MHLEVQIDGDAVPVTVLGARKILLLGEAHIGAVIDDESGSYVVGPLVHDRAGFPLDDSLYYAIGAGRGPIPIFDSMPDGDYNNIHRVLEAVAAELGLEVRRG